MLVQLTTLNFPEEINKEMTFVRVSDIQEDG